MDSRHLVRSAASATGARSRARLAAEDVALFLDVDGTLIDFAATPDAVSTDEDLIGLLAGAERVTRSAIALLSGRPIADLDRLFAPLRLSACGIHGYERRGADGVMHCPLELDERLQPVRIALMEFVAAHEGLLLEDKESALAVHYRPAPHLEEIVTTVVSRLALELQPEYELLEGEMVLEIKPASHTKGTAVEAFIGESPFAGRVPVYFGDDITDYDGFAAVRRHRGFAIAVGDRVTADRRLPNPAAMRSWLRSFVMAREAGW